MFKLWEMEAPIRYLLCIIIGSLINKKITFIMNAQQIFPLSINNRNYWYWYWYWYLILILISK